jgi:hypothetical protein
MKRISICLIAFAVTGCLFAACSAEGSVDPPASEPATEDALSASSPLEAYFLELRRLADEARASASEVAAELEPRAADLQNQPSDEEKLSLLSDLYKKIIAVSEAYMAGLEAIDPPPEVQSEHERFVEETEQQVANMEEAAQQVDSAVTVEDIAGLFEDDSFEQVIGLAIAMEPCFDLQAIADEHDIDVNLACSPFEDPDEPRNSSERSEFLTPEAQARSGGIRTYWLGEEFDVNGTEVSLNDATELLDPVDRDLGISLDYWNGGDGGGEGVTVRTYAASGNGAKLFRDDLFRDPGTSAHPVQIGKWPGELVTTTLGSSRPINIQALFIEVGEMVVVAYAHSGTTGSPGSDSNPLIDPDLLIATVAEQLRPYPE